MIGEKLANRYEIVSELGRGGMGVVYRARDPQLNREVAIKVIAPNLLTPETEQRFKTEAQVVARLDHPGIVGIHDFGSHQGSLFFVMPLVEGTSLRQLCREQAMTLGEILEIGIGVSEALDYSAAQGVIHRDIKPENIMITRQAGVLRARVMDFGLARGGENTGITKTGVLVGTMSYLSPEQASGRGADARSDIYSLGTVLYECVTGDVPFSGDMQAVLYRVVHEIPQTPRERGAEIGAELDRIITWCLAKDPAERPQKPGEVASALRAYKSSIHDSEQNRSVMVTRVVQAPRAAAAPFVGRKEESREIQQKLNAAVAGESQFVVLAGEAGVGKTRLLDELEGIAHARQIRVLHGRFVEQDGAFPYHGFSEAIQEYFRQKESGSRSSSPADFSDLAEDLVALFPMLGEIDAFRGGSAAEASTAPGGEARLPENRTQIFELLARTLTRVAGGHPLVLLFEDLHGAEASVEALRYIVRRLGPTPTLIVGTYRSTEVDRRHPLTGMLEGFRGDRHFTEITMGPLNRSEHRELLATLIPGAEVSDDLATRLYDGTEGNPYFTKEMVRSLMDAGSIVRDETGIWSLSGGMEISSEALPATIQQAVEKRVARLPDELRSLLSTAAVMGKSFDFRDLEALAGGEGDLDDDVDRLIKEGLIEEDRQSRGDMLAFTSGVVRDVLFAELSRRKRRSLHRKFAAQLEKRHAGKLDRVYPQLVYHYAEGDIPEKTVEFGLKHARRSLESFSPEEAIRSVKTALEFLDEEWEGDESLEGEARQILAGAHHMAGDTEAFLRETGAAIKVFEKLQDRPRVIEAMLAGARAAWQSHRAEEARAWVERGLSVARAAGDKEKLPAFLSLAATLANLRGEYARAAAFLKEAESLGGGAEERAAAEKIPDGGTLVVALANPVMARELARIQTVEDWEIYCNAVEPLVTTAEQGDLAPYLCERWEVRDEGRSFSFILRPGVKFQDGTPVTADDAKAAFETSIKRCAGDLAPGFTPISGVEAFRAGQADQVAGIKVESELALRIDLDEPLPIYPALLTDARMGIYRGGSEDGTSPLVGTGPFRLSSLEPGRIRMERHPGYWRGGPAHVDAIEFRHGVGAAEIAAGLESGEIDLAGELLPKDLERLAALPRFRRGLVETSMMSTYFLIFTTHPGAAAADERVRTALAGVLRPHDLVWKTLGRLAQPAVSIIPPGMLGHEPGRRRRPLGMDEARAMLKEAGAPESLTLRAGVHPIVQEQYGALLEALKATWKELGATVEITTPDLASYIEAGSRGSEFDVGIRRWKADYIDPDNFTHNLFHSANGEFRSWYSSPESDRILDEARRETSQGARESLYRKFEHQLIQAGIIVPLFHDVDYRLASPKIRGLRLRTTSPVVNYAALGKAEQEETAPETQPQIQGSIQVPMSAGPTHLDPARSATLEDSEVFPAIYETLTVIREGRFEPFLARSWRIEESGKKHHVTLRDNITFHDGRKMTARDVRYSLERFLQSEAGTSRREVYTVIQGAREIIEGRSRELTGFHIRSATEFTFDLENPVGFFPALLSDIVTAVLPEGTPMERIADPARGAVGTGPFVVRSFQPERALALERNPSYWREGLPRIRDLGFTFNVPSGRILAGLKDGKYDVAADLSTSDLESLLRDPAFASAYREAPSLSTYFVVLNATKGPLRSADLRRRLLHAGNVPALVRRTISRRAIPTEVYIPPGLVGHEPSPPPVAPPPPSGQPREEVEVTAAVHPVFFEGGEYASFYKGLEEILRSARFRIRKLNRGMPDYVELLTAAGPDLIIGRWLADFPDAETFTTFLMSHHGGLGVFFGSEEVDKLAVSARREGDPAARHGIIRRLEEILRRDALLLPLFNEKVYRFARPEVEGLTVSFSAPTVAFESLRIRRA